MSTEDSAGWGKESSSTLRRPAAPLEPVRDDWEDEDSEEEIPIEERNKKIWDKANHEAAVPMPAFISSTSVASPPPPAAFQPALKILKRPVNSQTNSSSPPPSLQKESLGDREARYQAARNRIFGADSESATDSTSSEANSVHVASKKDNAVIRNPRGPDETDTVPLKGFDRRTTKSPSAAS